MQHREALGTVVGAGAGAVVGGAVADPYNKGTGVALGSIAGGLLGWTLGKGADAQGGEQMDSRRVEKVLETALRSPSGYARDQWSIGRNSYVAIARARNMTTVKDKWCKSWTVDTTMTIAGNRQTDGNSGEACYDEKRNVWVVR